MPSSIWLKRNLLKSPLVKMKIFNVNYRRMPYNKKKSESSLCLLHLLYYYIFGYHFKKRKSKKEISHAQNIYEKIKSSYNFISDLLFSLQIACKNLKWFFFSAVFLYIFRFCTGRECFPHWHDFISILDEIMDFKLKCKVEFFLVVWVLNNEEKYEQFASRCT